MIGLAISIPWIALFVVATYEESVKFNTYPSKVIGAALLVQILVLVGYQLGKNT